MSKHPVIRLALLLTCAATAAEADLTTLETQFRELPMAARRLTGPLYWLHGTETKAELENELARVAEGGNGNFTAEARPHNDWLGKGWYRDLDICLAAAKKHDLQMWIFDDYWWPSQMMGGRVPPEYGSKRLVATDLRVEGPKAVSEAGYDDPNLIRVIAGCETNGAVDGAKLVDLTSSVRDGTLQWNAPAGSWRLMKFTWQFNGTKGVQQKYVSVDGADPACVDWFIKPGPNTLCLDPFAPKSARLVVY